jgi:hypothetical protein
MNTKQKTQGMEIKIKRIVSLTDPIPSKRKLTLIHKVTIGITVRQ